MKQLYCRKNVLNMILNKTTETEPQVSNLESTTSPIFTFSVFSPSVATLYVRNALRVCIKQHNIPESSRDCLSKG